MSVPSLGSVISDHFHQTLVINLDRRPDRWRRVSEHLQHLGLNTFQRIAAVDGLQESDATCSRVCLRTRQVEVGSLPSLYQRGVLGCLKSHLKALKVAHQILQKNHGGKVLILEDDCYFLENSGKILKESLEALPLDWQFLMLGAIYHQAPGFISTTEKVLRVWEAGATHAYAVNLDSSLLAMGHIELALASRVIFPVDHIFITYQVEQKWYAVHPLIAGQYLGDGSDIGGEHLNHPDCFKLGVYINWRVWCWMQIRPWLARLYS